MLINRVFSVLVFCLISQLSLFSQEGYIKGKVIDKLSGESLIGVTVIIEGTTIGAATDLDGEFTIRSKPGMYTVQASYISYKTFSVKEVEVKAGEVTALGTIAMSEDATLMDEVVITAEFVQRTEAALMTMKRYVPNLIDGISSANFKKIGDADAGAALTRVTGITVQGGKYVYVRGLGDRYTKTTLNGMDVPGLDPDKNTVQMDLFPTNLIDNIVVSKSFTADQPADFTGGIVNIELRDFPDDKSFELGVGLGFNPAMHFNNNYIKQEGSPTDFLGFDNGYRDIPSDRRTNIPQFANIIGDLEGARSQEYQRILNGFNSQMAGLQATSFMNYSANASYSNSKMLKNSTLGYNFAITYKNDVEFYENAEFNLYAKSNIASEKELIPLERQIGDFGVNNVFVGLMGGFAIKNQQSKIRVNLLHLQNGESKAGKFDFENSNLGANFLATQYNVEYSERGLSNILIEGKHYLPSKWTINWKLSPTRSSIIDPDVRFLRFREPNQTIGTEVGLPERIWRFLEEYNVSGRGDATKEYAFLGADAKFKFGSSYTYKIRNYDIQNFQIIPGNRIYTGNPDELFQEDNLFSPSNIGGVRHEPMFIPTNPNTFTSSVNHIGLYASNEFKLMSALKAIIGLRVESYDQFYTGTNQLGTLSLNNEKVISDVDFFPSLNLIYSINEMQNIRASFSQTTARPTFKEMSYAEILDPITGRTFIGSMLSETTNNGQDVLWDGNLVSTDIFNYDLRWELYQENGQLISASLFYKQFINPIEMVQFLADPGSFQARNVGNAEVAGIELEIRKSLGFLSYKLENLSFNSNITFARSEIELSDSEFRSRTLSAREGEKVEKTREMAGQAPYVFNAGLGYRSPKLKLEGGMFYNVQGPTLLFVGFANRTNVYSVPFHSLNFKAGKTLGENDNINISFKVSNILNDIREQVFSSFEAQDQFFTRLQPQRTFSISASIKL